MEERERRGKKESLHPSFSSLEKTKGDKQSKKAASNKSEKRGGKRKMNGDLAEFFSAREKNTEKENEFSRSLVGQRGARSWCQSKSAHAKVWEQKLPLKNAASRKVRQRTGPEKSAESYGSADYSLFTSASF